MKNAIEEIYKRRIEKYSNNLDKVNKKINLIVFFRLIIFISFYRLNKPVIPHGGNIKVPVATEFGYIE